MELWIWVAPNNRLVAWVELEGKGGSLYAASCLSCHGLSLLCNAPPPSLRGGQPTGGWNFCKLWAKVNLSFNLHVLGILSEQEEVRQLTKEQLYTSCYIPWCFGMYILQNDMIKQINNLLPHIFVIFVVWTLKMYSW